MNASWLFLLLFMLPMYVQAVTPSASKVADFDGVKIRYITTGSGSNAIVFVHGWACTAEVWKESLNAFPQYRVVALDLPGHGQSAKPHTDYTMDYFARSIEAVMRHAGIERAVLVGHSMGTAIVRQFYRLYPSRTLGLVIVDGELKGANREEAELHIAPLRIDYNKAAAELIDDMLRPMASGRLKQDIRAMMLATPDYVTLSSWEQSMDAKVRKEDPIHVPVLAILAARTSRHPDTEAFLHSIASDVDLQIWDGVSHFLMMERPDAFNEALAQFILTKEFL